MPQETPAVLLAVLIVSLVSIVGALLLVANQKRLKPMLPLLVALAAGALLGDTFLHLLPEAVGRAGGFTPNISWGILAGLLGFLVIEGTLHWHHHGEDVHDHGPGGIHSFGWMNLLGDFVHNIVDGMLIAAAFLSGGTEIGVATTIAVLLHEIPQEFGDFGVLLHAGFSPKKALLLNFGTACSAFIGAFIVLIAHEQLHLEEVLVPIAAGGFLYIACADLIPELRKRSGKQLVLAGLALAVGLLLMVLVHEIVPHDHGGHGGEGHHGHSHGSLPADDTPDRSY